MAHQTRERRGLFGSAVSARLIHGATQALGLQVAGAMLGLTMNVILARAMGAASYGTYSFLFALTGFAGVIGTVGLDSTILRFVPEYLAKDAPQYAAGLFRAANVGTFLLAGAAGCALFVGMRTIHADALTAIGTPSMLLAASLVPGFALIGVSQKALRAHMRVLKALVGDYVLRPALITAGIAGLWVLLRHAVSVPSALSVTLATVALVVGLQYGWLGRDNAATAIKGSQVAYEPKRWLRVSLPLFGNAVLSRFLQRADILIVGSLLSASDVAYFNAATRVALLMSFGLTALNTLAAPLMSQAHAKGETDELKGIVTSTVRAGGLFGAIVAIAIGLGNHWILRLFGRDFGAAAGPLLVLLLGQLVNVAVGPVLLLLTMTDRQRGAFRILAVAAALNLVIGLVGTMLWGVVGAAAGTATAMVAWNLAMVIFARAEYGWWIVPFWGVFQRDAPQSP